MYCFGKKCPFTTSLKILKIKTVSLGTEVQKCFTTVAILLAYSQKSPDNPS